MEIIPFEDRLIGAAAALLSSRFRALIDSQPVLAAAYADAAVAREAVGAAAGASIGVAVVDGDDLSAAVVTARARSRAVGRALLSRVIEWVRERPFRHCAVGWTSANAISDTFWRGHGFEPVRYTLVRRLGGPPSSG